MWETPIRVITAALGRAARVSLCRSPLWSIPISITAYRVSSSSRNRVAGIPISLFWFPSVLGSTESGKTAAQNSLVVVLPTLPVTPTTSG